MWSHGYWGGRGDTATGHKRVDMEQHPDNRNSNIVTRFLIAFVQPCSLCQSYKEVFRIIHPVDNLVINYQVLNPTIFHVNNKTSSEAIN